MFAGFSLGAIAWVFVSPTLGAVICFLSLIFIGSGIISICDIEVISDEENLQRMKDDLIAEGYTPLNAKVVISDSQSDQRRYKIDIFGSASEYTLKNAPDMTIWVKYDSGEVTFFLSDSHLRSGKSTPENIDVIKNGKFAVLLYNGVIQAFMR